MPTFSTNRGYTIPVVGGDVNSWGTELATTINLVDQNNSGSISVNVAGNSNVALTSAQIANLAITFTGALTGNIQVSIPSGLGGFWIFVNKTSGAFTLSLLAVGGTFPVTLAQLSSQIMWSDATNLRAGSAST